MQNNAANFLKINPYLEASVVKEILRRCKSNIFAKNDHTLQYLLYDSELAETFILRNPQLLSRSFELEPSTLYRMRTQPDHSGHYAA